MKTIGLENNDLYVDEFNNLGIKDGLERLAQDVASSVKVWKGELPRDIQRGIDYNDIDGIQDTLNHDIIQQANLVEGVAEVTVDYERRENRVLTPTIYVKSEDGEVVEV
jgi:hypothetical protein